MPKNSKNDFQIEKSKHARNAQNYSHMRRKRQKLMHQ